MTLIKKFMPVFAVLLSCVAFALLITKHQNHLNQGQIIYAKLAPADPRSLIQGDYMQLNYELFWANYPSREFGDFTLSTTSAPPTMLAKVTLDDKNIIIATDRWGKTGDRLLRLKNPSNYLDTAHPAVNSFMFAEGLGECYERAKYAKLSVLDNGDNMLVDLVADDLTPLNCEKGQKWQDGAMTP